MCVLGQDQVSSLGMVMEQMVKLNLMINTADGAVARNLGMVFLEILGVRKDGVQCTTQQQSYFFEGHLMLDL